MIEKIAAYASREHGDARKAVELLSKAARIAEIEGSRLSLETVDKAYDALEVDSYLEFVKTAPLQLQAVLCATLENTKAARGSAPASEIYNAYEKICRTHGVAQLSHRRFADLLLELELYGFIRTQKVSMGRYGRKKEISLLVSPDVLARIKATILLCLTSEGVPGR